MEYNINRRNNMRIGVDMDGTVVDFTTASFNKVEELYGIKLTKDDAYKPKTAQLVWERMTEEQRARYTDHRELYAEICDDGFFYTLKPFPDAVEAVKTMARAGHEIVWITKVLNWERSAHEKDKWLKQYFNDIDYHKIMVDSVHAKQLVNVDVIIDDDPRVLADIDGPIPIMMKQPWNDKVRGKYEFEVENMTEAADIVLQLAKHANWWEKAGME